MDDYDDYDDFTFDKSYTDEKASLFAGMHKSAMALKGLSLIKDDFEDVFSHVKIFNEKLDPGHQQETLIDINKTSLSPNDLERRFRPRLTDETKVPFVASLACLHFMEAFDNYFFKKIYEGKKAGLSDFFILRGPSGYGKSYALAYFVFYQRILKVSRIFYINNPNALRSRPKEFIIRELVYFTHPDSSSKKFVTYLSSVLKKFKNISQTADTFMSLELEEDEEEDNQETYGAWREVWCELRSLILERSDAHFLRDLIADLIKYYDKNDIKRILIIDKAHDVYSEEEITRKGFEVFHEAVKPHEFNSTILCASNNRIIACSADIKYEDFELDLNAQKEIRSFYEYIEPFTGAEMKAYLQFYLVGDKFKSFYENDPQTREKLQLTSNQTWRIPLQVNQLCKKMNEASTENQPNFKDLINDYHHKSIEQIRNKFEDHLSANANHPLYYPALVACVLGIPILHKPNVDKRFIFYDKAKFGDSAMYRVFPINGFVRLVILEFFNAERLQNLAAQTLTYNENELMKSYKLLINNTSPRVDQGTKGKVLESIVILAMSEHNPMILQYSPSKSEQSDIANYNTKTYDLRIPKCERRYINTLNIAAKLDEIISTQGGRENNYLFIPEVSTFPISDLWLVKVPIMGLIEIGLIQVTVNIKNHKIKSAKDKGEETKMEEIPSKSGETKAHESSAMEETQPKNIKNIKEEYVEELSDYHFRKVLEGKIKCKHSPCETLFALKDRISCSFYWLTNESSNNHKNIQEYIHKDSKIIYLEKNQSQLGML